MSKPSPFALDYSALPFGKEAGRAQILQRICYEIESAQIAHAAGHGAMRDAHVLAATAYAEKLNVETSK